MKLALVPRRSGAKLDVLVFAHDERWSDEVHGGPVRRLCSGAACDLELPGRWTPWARACKSLLSWDAVAERHLKAYGAML